MLRKHLSKLYYTYLYSSPLGQRFRTIFKKAELAELKPLSSKAVISDLFVWKKSLNWQTDFKLFNISSFLFPEEMPKEECEIHIFTSEGVFIKKFTYFLEAFGMQQLDLTLLTKDVDAQVGTFCVFHFSDVISKIAKKGSHLTERGYISYRHKDQVLHNFCHGNLQSLSKKRNGKIHSVVGLSNYPTAYHPQMLFSDCNEFELVYTNPSKLPQEINVVLYDKNKNELKRIMATVKPFGVEQIIIPNTSKDIHTISNWGHIVMWRPIVFKYYNSHFDVLHG